MYLKHRVATSLCASLLVLALALAAANAQSSAGASSPQPAAPPAPGENLGCKGGMMPDLSNTYVGKLSLGPHGTEDKEAVIKIKGRTFKLTSDSYTGEGIIIADNFCGQSSVTLRFKKVKGVDSVTASRLRTSGLSVKARVVSEPLDKTGIIKPPEDSQSVVLIAAPADPFASNAGRIEVQGCPKPPCSRKYIKWCPRCVE